VANLRDTEALGQRKHGDYAASMGSIRIKSGNGRSINEEMQTAMDLLDDAAISYGVNILVADADQDAATSFFHGARVQFTAGGYPA
jgi:hypothetical protein